VQWGCLLRANSGHRADHSIMSSARTSDLKPEHQQLAVNARRFPVFQLSVVVALILLLQTADDKSALGQIFSKAS
jgi:hypothetical protein